MATLRKLERELLRRKYGNKHLSKLYRKFKDRLHPVGGTRATKKRNKKKSLFKKIFSFNK